MDDDRDNRVGGTKTNVDSCCITHNGQPSRLMGSENLQNKNVSKFHLIARKNSPRIGLVKLASQQGVLLRSGFLLFIQPIICLECVYSSTVIQTTIHTG